MKWLDILSKLSIVIILIIVVTKVTEKKESLFFEYKNTKINLNQVKKVVPKIDYIITYKENNNSDIFRKYSVSLNENEIENIKSMLNLARKSDFYNIEILSYMMLDSEKVILFHSSKYLKKATQYSVNDNLLQELRKYGIDNYQYQNLEQLKDKVYDNAQAFLDDVVSYAKIKKLKWVEKSIPKLGLEPNGAKFMSILANNAIENEITEAEIQTILRDLQQSYRVYKGIH
jgi:predicted HTH domain antitoxin